MKNKNNTAVKLDLNNPAFQRQLTAMEKAEVVRVIGTLRKLLQLTWEQVYRDQGLKWEKIVSVPPPAGAEAVYSVRITQSRRATAYRDGDFLRFLTIEPDHDATYGKK